MTDKQLNVDKRDDDSIRYLNRDEKERTKRLWESCFAEDSNEFVSYYYKEKIQQNRILVKLDGNDVITMLHRNPYQIRMRKKHWNVDYIVGVATRYDRRKKGYMEKVLITCLNDMNREHMPFTFLMPVSEAIYYPYSFRFVEWEKCFSLNQNENLERKEVSENEYECTMASEWMMKWIKSQYEMSTVRDSEYVKRLIQELKSEQGKLEFLLDRGNIVGLQAFWGMKQREQRLLYIGKEWCEQKERKPRIMARITDVMTFLTEFCLMQPGTLRVELRLKDEQIEQQNSVFFWEITEQGSEIKKGNQKEKKQSDDTIVLNATIGEITEWLFGVRTPKDIWREQKSDEIDRLNKIRILKTIFFDEIV